MDTPLIQNDWWYLTPEQCEALGLIQTDPQPTTSTAIPSMTREWGLTDEQCISWEYELQQALETIPSSPESWFDNMLNDLPNEPEEIGKDSAYSGRATATHEHTTQPRGLGTHKKTIRIDDSLPQMMDYSDSEDGVPPSPKRLRLVDYSDTDEDIGGVAPSYELVEAHGRHIFGRQLMRRYEGTTATDQVFHVRFANDGWQGRRLVDLYDELNSLWKDLLRDLRDNQTVDTNLVRLHISHRGLLKGDIKVSLRPLSQMTPEAIGSRIEEVLQSNQDLPFDASFAVTVGVIHLPRGGGRTKVMRLHGIGNSIHKKKSMVEISNDDNLCLARALVVCRTSRQYIAGEIPIQIYRQIKKNYRPVQRREAEALHHEARVPTNRPSSLVDIPMFEQTMNARIIVFSAAQGNRVVYPKSIPDDDKPIYYVYLVPSETGDGPGHFHAVVSPKGFLGQDIFCIKCLKGHNNGKKHRCEGTCNKCRKTDCEPGDPVTCRDCNVTCVSEKCYRKHKTGPKSACDLFWGCLKCHRHWERKERTAEQHVCGEWLCPCCMTWITDPNHRCYLRCLEPKPMSDKYVFFDFEAIQENITHEPNLVVAHTCCASCIDQPLYPESKCQVCGQRCSDCGQMSKGEYARMPWVARAER